MKQEKINKEFLACPKLCKGRAITAIFLRKPAIRHGGPFLSLTKTFGYSFCLLLFILIIFSIQSTAAIPVKLTVSQDGKANFRPIQEAINSLPDSAAENRIIFIKNGTYNEKIFISKHHISLIGESRDQTIITYDIARDAWRCEHPDDWGVATLNLSGSDIELQNLTIINGYGYHHKENITVVCKGDSTGKKAISPFGHQMALRSFATTRLSVINCNLKSFSGDTVSPWNTDAGMFYFKDCYMEGGVDFYCPRGWAYAENCTFYTNHSDAAIWHDGSVHKDSKTVLVDCKFDGYNGFKLGRYHKDAQFYLLNCSFSKNMADKPIYRVATNNVIQWGERIYYYNCHRIGGDYRWFANNLNTAANAPLPTSVNISWVFGYRWNPTMGTPGGMAPGCKS